eukprot:jgi/Chrzof1/6083/Cz17g09030.t1
MGTLVDQYKAKPAVVVPAPVESQSQSHDVGQVLLHQLAELHDAVLKSHPNTDASNDAHTGSLEESLKELTHLHNEFLETHDGNWDDSNKQALDLLETYMQAGVEAVKQLNNNDGSALDKFIARWYLLLHGLGKPIPCRLDDSLVFEIRQLESNRTTAANDQSQHATPSYFFAANLYNNDEVIPHFIFSLIQTLLRLPNNRTFVSVYESGSSDDTATWLHVLQLSLDVIGVPSSITTRGSLIRHEGQGMGQTARIDFQAEVRNAALQPLYDRCTACTNRPHNQMRRLTFDPDYIVFINDVYFCWGDVVRLMNYGADIACGMDYKSTDPWHQPPEEARNRPWPDMPADVHLQKPILQPEVESVLFYDKWVTRDVTGDLLNWWSPFSYHQATADSLSSGLPTRVYCCWNGLVVLNAAPFKAGLRVRSHLENECAASECSLLCDDYHRLGFSNVVMDPSVMLGYEPTVAKQLIACKSILHMNPAVPE